MANNEKEVKLADEKEVREKKADGSESRGIGGWFSDIRGEFRKIFWPNRKELINNTITVIVTSAIIAAIVFVMDLAFGEAYSLILDLASNFRS